MAAVAGSIPLQFLSAPNPWIGQEEVSHAPDRHAFMKFVSAAFTPTKNRRLNELIGFLLFVSALLLFLALASYSPADPSLNTASNRPAWKPTHNWIGIVGAYGSDFALQVFGIAVFFVPVFLVMLGIRWWRSRPVDSYIAKLIGSVSLFIFFSGLLGLLPWHWRWLHAVPPEGLARPHRRRRAAPPAQRHGRLHRLAR